MTGIGATSPLGRVLAKARNPPDSAQRMRAGNDGFGAQPADFVSGCAIFHH
jgi:hypothetical protein